MTRLAHHDPAVRDLIEQARAQAWDEGHAAGLNDAGGIYPQQHRTTNPYLGSKS